MTDATEDWVRHYWDAGPSTRTFLYYSYLLIIEDGRDRSLRDTLLTLVSIQETTPNTIINTFVSVGIYVNESCVLTPQAAATIGTLLQSSCGIDGRNIPLNGLRIARSDLATREKIWVDEGIEAFCQMFGSNSKKPSININIFEVAGGKILLLERSLTEPFICVYFMHTVRMTRIFEAYPLIDFIEDVRKHRELEIINLSNISIKEAFNGIKSIKILAAPTYQQGIASSLYADNRNQKIFTIGPINLSFIHFHTQNFTLKHTDSNGIYDFFINYMHPDHRHMPTGIIFSTMIIKMLQAFFRY